MLSDLTDTILQTSKSLEDGMRHVDLNSNVEALYVQSAPSAAPYPRFRAAAESIAIAFAVSRIPSATSRQNNSYEMSANSRVRRDWKTISVC